MKILIAHDGSPQAEALLADVPRCGLPASGEAVVLSVADAWTAVEGDAGPAFAGAAAGVGGEILRAALAQARSTAERGRAALAALLPGWSVAGESVAGSPAWEIIRKADEWKPDLVLLGATGTSPFEKLVFGTTTSQVAGHVTCSVRVGRPRPGASGPVRLVVGCDGSEAAQDAARSVASRTWPAGSSVRIVTALDNWLLAAVEDDREGSASELEARAAALPEAMAPILRGAGLQVEIVTRRGDPKKMLAQEADAFDADCIVVGARGRTGLARLLLGSVALATAARAHRSVEIVRAPHD